MAEPYRIGDHVNYACSGVCRVADIRSDPPKAREAPKTFYILKPVADPGSTIFVPTTSQTLLAKMQPLPTREEVDRLILSTREETLAWIDDRKARAASFQALLKVCDLRELLRLVGCIYGQKQALAARGRKLAASDEAALRRAEGIIQNELSFVLQVPDDQVGAYIRQKLEINE
ncbi:MAG: CarD family transcriptional regulator [Bacillota bacterium]|nr:CarD family transcriptional regulator [Bacillota bacterium]